MYLCFYCCCIAYTSSNKSNIIRIFFLFQRTLVDVAIVSTVETPQYPVIEAAVAAVRASRSTYS